VKLSAPVRVDRPVPPSAIFEHRRLVARDLWSWWVLGPVQWGFQTIPAQEDTLSRIAAGLALVAGHEFHLRRTEMPFHAAGWAQALDASTPDPLPDVAGCSENWATLLQRGQGELAGATLRFVALGVSLGRLPRKHRIDRDELPADMLAIEAKLDERFAGAGFAARPIEANELAWLVHRSVGLGLAAPALPPLDWWDEDASREVAARVRWTTRGDGLGLTTKVTGEREGRLHESHVAVLSMGRMEDQRFPENGRAPWLGFLDGLCDPETGQPIPVESSVRGRIVDGREGTSTADRWLRRARSIDRHYAEHGEEAPPTVQRTIEHAVEIHDEVSEGAADLAARFEGVVRIAVPAPSERKALALARLVQSSFSEELHMWPEHPGGIAEPFVQPRLLREFNPGADYDRTGYVRRMKVRVLAAGVPHAGDTVGTPGGMLLGHTVGAARRPVFHDGHYPMRHNRPEDPNNNSGFVGLVGNLGSGKSAVAAMLAEERARAGIPTFVLDPSPGAPLAGLCELPYLRDYAVHIGLAGAQAGLLDPYRMIPDPVRLQGWSEDRWATELAVVAGDRVELVVDTLMSLLPDSTRKRDGVEDAVREAVEAVGGAYGSSLFDVLDVLEQSLPAQARTLRQMASGVARLIFPTRTAVSTAKGLITEVPKHAVLTVITTDGLSLPDPEMDREDWSGRERAAYTALGLAVALTLRGVYGKRPSDPATVILDEIRVAREWGSLRRAVKKFGFEGRKSTVEVLAICQDPEHLTALGVAPFLGGVLLGRQVDSEVAARCLEMGGIAADPAVLLDLPSRHFVYRDTFGRVAEIRAKEMHAALLAATNTSAGESMREAS
jgi:hypothetical protein